MGLFQYNKGSNRLATASKHLNPYQRTHMFPVFVFMISAALLTQGSWSPHASAQATANATQAYDPPQYPIHGSGTEGQPYGELGTLGECIADSIDYRDFVATCFGSGDRHDASSEDRTLTRCLLLKPNIKFDDADFYIEAIGSCLEKSSK